MLGKITYEYNFKFSVSLRTLLVLCKWLCVFCLLCKNIKGLKKTSPKAPYQLHEPNNASTLFWPYSTPSPLPLPTLFHSSNILPSHSLCFLFEQFCLLSLCTSTSLHYLPCFHSPLSPGSLCSSSSPFLSPLGLHFINFSSCHAI